MANKTAWTRVKEAIRNLSVTVTLIIGFISILEGLTKGVSGLIIQVGGEWHLIRNSSDVQEMVSDIGRGASHAVTYESEHGWEICLAIVVVLVTNYLRVRLYVRPREKARNAYMTAQKERNPSVYERGER